MVFRPKKGLKNFSFFEDLTSRITTSYDSPSGRLPRANPGRTQHWFWLIIGENFSVKNFPQKKKMRTKRILITLLLSQARTPPRELPSSYYCLINFDYYQLEMCKHSATKKSNATARCGRKMRRRCRNSDKVFVFNHRKHTERRDEKIIKTSLKRLSVSSYLHFSSGLPKKQKLK